MAMVVKAYAMYEQASRRKLQNDLQSTINNLEKDKLTPTSNVLRTSTYETPPEKVIRLLAEIKDQVKTENGRDKKRAMFEFYDRHYKKIIAGMGIVAVGATISSGMLAGYALMGLPAKLSLMQNIVQVATPVLATSLAGAGVTNLIIRAGYFIDCNGKFQEARRGRDTFLEAMVKLGVFDKKNEIKKVIDTIGSQAVPTELNKKLLKKIEKEITGIKKYVNKMERRDNKQKIKEMREVGRQATNFRRSNQAEELAKTEFNQIGLTDYFPYFVKRNKQVMPIHKAVPTVNEPTTPLQQACAVMKKEIDDPNFPNLHNAIVSEVQGFLQKHSTVTPVDNHQTYGQTKQSPMNQKQARYERIQDQQIETLSTVLTQQHRSPVNNPNRLVLRTAAKRTNRALRTASLIKRNPELWREILGAAKEELTTDQPSYQLAK